MRAGVLAMGPLLGKLNKCKVALSGGCALGVRPKNFHLKVILTRKYYIPKRQNVKTSGDMKCITNKTRYFIK